jgi:hypothetical protein
MMIHLDDESEYNIPARKFSLWLAYRSRLVLSRG